MDHNPETELHKISHIILLITLALFSITITVINRLFQWEIWPLPVIIGCTIACWALYIMRIMHEKVHIYFCGVLLMFMAFYYTVNIHTIYDSAVIIVLMVFIFAFTEQKPLIISGVMVSYIGIFMHLIKVGTTTGLRTDASNIVRTVMILVITPLAAILAGLIISAWKNTEKEYNKKLDELKKENESANNFLANVSHEIRTPINAVVGLSGVLKKEELSSSALSNVESIEEAGHRVAEQISDILDFTEIDMNKLSVTNENYMITSLINDLLTQLSFSDNKNLDLIVDIEAETPSELKGDPAKIKKILWHLIRNGYKFTKDGGVYVHVYPLKRYYGINLILEVKDTGIGMNRDEIDHIYDKFYQSDSGRSRNTGGLGLGMSIVNGFTKAMGGVLAIESKPGEGTTVRVSIPQEIDDEEPCISISNSDQCNVVGFLGFMTTDNQGVKEFYMDMISHLTKELGVNFGRVKSRKELERMIESKTVTHVFVGTGEYNENRNYIDELAKTMNVALVADRGFKGDYSPLLTLLPKPFYGSQVAYFLNKNFDSYNTSSKEVMTCPGIKVLVVDDEPMNLFVAKGIFETYGMIVSCAVSGMESIEMCEENDYDIIFMDHMMPEMDGVEAMKKLRYEAAKRQKELCIVALTANAMSSAKEMFLSVGFNGFVPKPIELSELERVLKHVLPPYAIKYTSEDEIKKNESKAKEPSESGNEKVNAPENNAKDPDPILNVKNLLSEVGIDVACGIMYSQGDFNFYNQVLAEYSKNKEARIKEIDELFKSENFENYTIKVHAIKSTSKMIGADKLYTISQKLENASKMNDKDTCANLHPEFIKMYENTLNGISKYLYGNNIASEYDSGEIMEFSPESEGEDE